MSGRRDNGWRTGLIRTLVIIGVLAGGLCAAATLAVLALLGVTGMPTTLAVVGGFVLASGVGGWFAATRPSVRNPKAEP